MTSDKRMSDGMLERLRATIKAVAGKPIPVMLRKDASPEVHAYFEVALTGLPNLLAEIDALRADLAAARRVEDQEVADLIESLETYTPGSLASRVSSAHHADIVLRLSAAKEEAERMAKRFMSEAEDWKWAAGDREKERDDALERLVQAERERDRARTDALEEACKAVFVEREMSPGGTIINTHSLEASRWALSRIRALTPAPIPAQEEP